MSLGSMLDRKLNSRRGQSWPTAESSRSTTANHFAGILSSTTALLIAVIPTLRWSASFRRPMVSQIFETDRMIPANNTQKMDWQESTRKETTKCGLGVTLRAMGSTQKEQLSLHGTMALSAFAIRLRASRMVAEVDQKTVAESVGIQNTAYSNMERGISYPSRDVMKYFYRNHRIDFNFLMYGEFAQLPGDVQDRLFHALVDASNEWDRKERSNRNSTSSRPARQGPA